MIGLNHGVHVAKCVFFFLVLRFAYGGVWNRIKTGRVNSQLEQHFLINPTRNQLQRKLMHSREFFTPKFHIYSYKSLKQRRTLTHTPAQKKRNLKVTCVTLNRCYTNLYSAVLYVEYSTYTSLLEVKICSKIASGANHLMDSFLCLLTSYSSWYISRIKPKSPILSFLPCPTRTFLAARSLWTKPFSER